MFFQSSLLVAILLQFATIERRDFVNGVDVSPPDEAVVHLDVYYESLCPDSMKFVTQQLWPTYQKISSIIKLQLVPYGKASYYRQGDDWIFTCQHGPPECRGNKIQACALNFYPQIDEILPFINCVMGSNYPPDAGSQCASGLNWEQISTCSTNKQGQDILHEMGVKTESLDPKLHFIPWIVVNGKTSNEILDAALTDLLGLICKTYSGPNPPKECST